MPENISFQYSYDCGKTFKRAAADPLLFYWSSDMTDKKWKYP